MARAGELGDRLRWWAALAVAWLLVAVGTARAHPSGRRSVLVIDSYGAKWGTANRMNAKLREGLVVRSGPPFDFVEVSLEAGRQGAEAIEHPLIDYIHAIFAESSPALVVSVGWPAAEFVTSHRDALFPETPALLTAIGAMQTEALTLGPTDALVSFLYDPAWFVAKSLEVLPGRTRLFVVEGSSDEERATRQRVEPYLRAKFPSMEQVWPTGLTFEQMISEVERLGDDTLVAYSAFEVDGAGTRIQDDVAMPAVVRAARVPVMGAFQHLIGTGVLGTFHFDIEAHAAEAVRVAAALLAGESPASHRGSSPYAVGITIDGAQLERWGIPKSVVPPEAVIVNERQTFWGAYRGYIIAGLILAIVQAAFIAALLANRRRLHRERQVSADLRRRLVTAQEDEQRRVSRELHDDFAQRLSRLALDVARLVQPGADVRSVAGEMREVIGSLATDVSAMSYRLHPATLEDLGLVEAVRQECAAFKRRERIEVNFTGSVRPDLVGSEVAVALYRVLQESLRNVSRHAKANHVQVTLMAVGDRVQLAVRDDGVGFAPAAVGASGPHLGLASMRERMTLVGGEVAIESEPGAGTSIVASVEGIRPESALAAS